MDKEIVSQKLYTVFDLRGKTLNPQEITDYLGIQPSRSFMRGEMRTNNKKWPHGYWALESSKFVQSTDLALHLEWLINQLESVKTKLYELVENQQLTATISCFWIMSGEHDGLVLSSELIQQAASLKVPIEFDIYCPD